MFLDKLVLEARRANSFLESSPTNIEDILSFSQMGERLGLTHGENRNHHLLEIIQKIYTTVPPDLEYWQRYQPFKKLIGAEPREFNGTLSFVTTNYDLNIESACNSLRTYVNPGFEVHTVKEGNVHTVSNFYDSGRIPLYKLHGSVNWYLTDNEPGLVVEDRVVAVQASFHDKHPRSLPYPCVADYKAPGIPVIVPPSFLKPDLPKALKAVWSGAARVLSKANIVAFVGYSFPFSDTDMMFFLARALSENAGLRKVYLVDPRADDIAARLRSPISKIGSHFRNLLHPIARGWTDVALPL
jgi:hypothetical protein